MPKQIQVDNQIIEFPDDMPDNEIEAVIKKEFYSQPQPQQPIKPAQPFGMGAELVKKASEYIPQQGRIGAFLNTATNLLGMPRVKALTASLSAKALGGDESIGAFYDEALGNELKKLKQAREQYPKTSIGGQLLADVASARLLGIKGLTTKAALTGGAVIGGLSAAGETEADLASSQGLADIGAGSLYGAGGGVVGQQAGKLIGKSVPFVKGVAQRFKGSTPESIISKVITPEEAGQLAKKLSSRIQQGRITALPELGDENISGLIPELGNENILGLTRILGKTQGSNKIITSYINNKTATSAKRVGDLLNNNLSAESYFNKLDDTILRRKEVASPLFTKAYQEGNDALKQAMTMPATGNAKLGKVRELINDDRIKNAIMTARKDYGINQEIPDISIESLHGARQVVDDIIGSAKRAGENNKARSYIDLKNKINNVVYDVAPTMKEADKTFAGFSALKNAQEEGLKFNQYRNGEEVKRAFTKLSDGEKEAYKIGVKDYLIDKVSKSSERNPSRVIFGNQLEYGKLKAVFENPKQFKDFAKRLTDEIRVFDVKQRIVGGSRTDFNLAESDQLLDKIAKGALNLKTFGLADVAMVAKDAIKRKYYGLNEKTAKELAQVLISPEKSVQTLNNIVKQAQTAQERGLIQKFTGDLSKRNFTAPIASKLGRAMATEQINNEGEQNGI